MRRFDVPDHPDIESALRTGYPSWYRVRDLDVDDDYDDEYEELEGYTNE